MASETFFLNPIAPYNLNLSLQRLKRDPMYFFKDDAVYRTLRLDQALYVIKIHNDSNDKVNEQSIKVECVCLEGEIDPETVKIILTGMLAINCDLNEVYRYMNEDSVLKDLAKRYEGCHIFQDHDLFECLVKLIIAQQINLTFAETLTRNLLEATAETVVYDDVPLFVFPTFDRLANFPPEELVNLKFNRRKAEYIVNFAKNLQDGNADLMNLHQMSNSAVMDELLKIRGVGPWTIACFMLFGLGRKNVVPISDIGIQKAIQHVYSLPNRPTKDEVLQLSKRWDPIASYVSRYLWETLRVK